MTDQPTTERPQAICPKCGHKNHAPGQCSELLVEDYSPFRCGCGATDQPTPPAGARPQKWIEWIEPFGPNNEPVYMRVTEQTAIAVMKKAHPELTDEQALDEFIVVNWAARASSPAPTDDVRKGEMIAEHQICSRCGKVRGEHADMGDYLLCPLPDQWPPPAVAERTTYAPLDIDAVRASPPPPRTSVEELEEMVTFLCDLFHGREVNAKVNGDIGTVVALSEDVQKYTARDTLTRWLAGSLGFARTPDVARSEAHAFCRDWQRIGW